MRVLKASLENIRVASQVVRDGGLVVYPTDTVYGLGCDPFDVNAVKCVFSVKGDREKPLPILASSAREIKKIAHLSEVARNAAARFWPGPLTVIIPKKPALPDVVTCGLESVGVRVPRHDVAVQLIRLSGGLLVGSSANKTGQKPACTAIEALEQLGEEVGVVLDGGAAPLGEPSTVIDLTMRKPKILRKGPVSFEDVLETLP
ncbi:MAG: L-threonylcarbamoyladenylate synthase [Candidatus Bathyarchaeia archaeon]